jgi:hypothetical protein
MKYTRMYATPDGESHFEDVEVDLRKGAGGLISETLATAGMMFRLTTPDYDVSWHPAPRRYFIINVEGHVELQVSDGEKRVFGPGSIVLAEDTTGKGHISRAVNGEERFSVFVNVPASAE